MPICCTAWEDHSDDGGDDGGAGLASIEIVYMIQVYGGGGWGGGGLSLGCHGNPAISLPQLHFLSL